MTDIKIKAAARKGLIAANPDYFALPAPQQELFRATMHDAAHNKIDAMLLKELLHIQCIAENPNVIKLKKKRKIIIALGALDGLLGEDSDE